MSIQTTIANPDRVRANQERRRSSAAGFHTNRRGAGKGGRAGARRKAIAESRW